MRSESYNSRSKQRPSAGEPIWSVLGEDMRAVIGGILIGRYWMSQGCRFRVQKPRLGENQGKSLRQGTKHTKNKNSDNELPWSAVGRQQNQLRLNDRLLK